MNGARPTGYRKPTSTTAGGTMPYLQSSPPEEYSSGAPPAKVLMDEYQNSAANPYEERPRFNPLNSSRPRSSALLNVNDPVAMHLLVETALGDSQEFEVLSFEEIDELKKEYILLSNRVDAMKRKLALESKVRDAAESLSRLYTKKGRPDSPGSPVPKQRRSLLGSRVGSDKTDGELSTSRRKCEDLAQDLWRLEKRATEIQRRLLHHTAGILQMTHRATITKGQAPQGGGQNGQPPGSPESIYTYSNSRSSMTLRDDPDEFDERSLYRPAAGVDEYGTITATEKKIEDLNQRLRGLIVQLNPDQSQAYQSPPRAEEKSLAADPEGALQAQLTYLEQGLNDVDQQSIALRSVQRSETSTEERLEELNNRLQEFIHQMGLAQNEPLGPPPEISGNSVSDQLHYLEHGLDLVQQHGANSFGDSESQQEIDQFKAVLTGLWEIILSGEEEARQRNSSDRAGASPERRGASSEQFSLPVFSTKVQRLCGRVDGLMDEKDVLRRQIQQQRELNNKSDSERGAERERLTADINRYKQGFEQLQIREQERSGNHTAASKELEKRQEEIMRLESELEELKDDHGIARAELQGKMHETEEKMQRLLQELQDVNAQKQEIAASHEQVQSQIEEKTGELAHTRDEMEQLEGEVVRLQTEVTVARAELDGAYGTRAQRAAEVAINPALQKEAEELAARNNSLTQELEALKARKDSGDLQQQIQILKGELSETIEEYETMTKQSIEFEKEREQLENTIDGLRDRSENLESQLSEEKVRWLGMKSPSSGGREGGGPVESTSTATLKNEFKKMMRDTRAENMRALKAEQEERRKLEAIVRSMRKEPTQRKSGLSQSVVA